MCNFRHFQQTSHTFALQIGGQRVWDYAGDNYVHRLIQSKSDGKVVEFDPQNRDPQDVCLLKFTLLAVFGMIRFTVIYDKFYFLHKLYFS